MGGVRFERYVDDAVVRCASEKQALMLGDKLGRCLSHFGLRSRPRRGIEHPSRTWSGLAAALVLGALPALAFPAPSWWWLAWFGIVPLLLVVRAAPTARMAALWAWWGMVGDLPATHVRGLTTADAVLVFVGTGPDAMR